MLSRADVDVPALKKQVMALLKQPDYEDKLSQERAQIHDVAAEFGQGWWRKGTVVGSKSSQSTIAGIREFVSSRDESKWTSVAMLYALLKDRENPTSALLEKQGVTAEKFTEMLRQEKLDLTEPF